MLRPILRVFVLRVRAPLQVPPTHNIVPHSARRALRLLALHIRDHSRRGSSPHSARRALRLLAPIALLVLASGCGTDVGSPADRAGGTTAHRADEVPYSRDETPVGPVTGGRDPPASQARGAVVGTSDGENSWAPNAIVERVVDGDTIIARIGDRSETVRLIGLDAPESVAPTRPVQCFGPEASLFLAAVLPAGTEITLFRDEEARDIYDRLLGYVVRSHDGLFVNLEVVASGYAAVLTYPPNDHYADAFDRAEAEAVGAGRGLWRACGGPDVPLG